MDVVLFGASGNIGGAIAAELIARGHSVTGVTRSGGSGSAHRAGLTVRTGDVTDPTFVAEQARGTDAVISAVGPRFGSGQPHPFVAAARGLVTGLRRAGVRRLLVVGGAGASRCPTAARPWIHRTSRGVPAQRPGPTGGPRILPHDRRPRLDLRLPGGGDRCAVLT